MASLRHDLQDPDLQDPHLKDPDREVLRSVVLGGQGGGGGRMGWGWSRWLARDVMGWVGVDRARWGWVGMGWEAMRCDGVRQGGCGMG